VERESGKDEGRRRQGEPAGSAKHCVQEEAGGQAHDSLEKDSSLNFAALKVPGKFGGQETSAKGRPGSIVHEDERRVLS
jgi:hypothetical protein